MTVLYNEIEPFPAQWLRNLSDAGHIARGRVDERSIAELTAEDLHGVTQFHTFAGLGAWSYALRLAGWPDDAPVWTGSCPCQPFSSAGKGKGVDDERHLWPVWRELIRECSPGLVFGEQVASPAGRDWLASVRSEMEDLGYAFWAADLCAAGVGAPHIRQRLFWGAVRLGDADRIRARWNSGASARAEAESGGEGGITGGVGDCVGASGSDLWLENSHMQRREGERLQLQPGPTRPEVLEVAGRGEAGAWTDTTWLPCTDGKARPTQPGIHPLAHGSTARVGRLRAYGNAIVPQVAAAFVTAFLGAVNDTRAPARTTAREGEERG